MLASMSDLLSNTSFLICAAVTSICVVPSICHYWYKVRRCEIEAQLKQFLIDQGMCADDIIRVLEAGSDAQSEGGAKVVMQFNSDQKVHV